MEQGHGCGLSGAQPGSVLLSSGPDPGRDAGGGADTGDILSTPALLSAHRFKGDSRVSTWLCAIDRTQWHKYQAKHPLTEPLTDYSYENGTYTFWWGVESGDDLERIGLDRLNITAVELRYELDSKSFYQPVYVFSGTWQAPNKGTNSLELIVPALK